MGDADFLEKYEDAFRKMKEKEIKIQKTGKLSQVVKEYCEMHFELYDDIFGEGTSQKIFNGKKNQNEVNEVYDDFLDCVQKSIDESNAIMNNVLNRKKKRRNAQKKMYN